MNNKCSTRISRTLKGKDTFKTIIVSTKHATIDNADEPPTILRQQRIQIGVIPIRIRRDFSVVSHDKPPHSFRGNTNHRGDGVAP